MLVLTLQKFKWFCVLFCVCRPTDVNLTMAGGVGDDGKKWKRKIRGENCASKRCEGRRCHTPQQKRMEKTETQ